MVRLWATAAGALGVLGCNAIFGIEEGIPEPAAGSGSDGLPMGGGGVRDIGSGGNPRLEATGGTRSQESGGSGAGGAVNNAGGTLNGEPPPLDAGRDGSTGLPPDLVLAGEALQFAAGLFTHSLGITGTLGTTKSPVGATIEPDCADDASCFAAVSGDSVCVRGLADRVMDGDYVNAWGVNLQLNMTGGAWDRAGGRIKGISFVLGGSALPTMRFHATRPPTETETFSNYCQELQPVDGQRVDVIFANLKVACWNPAATNVLPADAILDTLGWQINAVADIAKPFDFCVSALRPIIDAE